VAPCSTRNVWFLHPELKSWPWPSLHELQQFMSSFQIWYDVSVFGPSIWRDTKYPPHPPLLSSVRHMFLSSSCTCFVALHGSPRGGVWGGGCVFSVLCWEENSIYDQGLYWFCFITRDHNSDRISLSWQIISYYVLNLADCIANFRNLDSKRRKARKVQRGLFWENWAQVTTYEGKKQSHQIIGGVLNIWPLVKFDEGLLCMLANPPTSQIWKKKKKEKKTTEVHRWVIFWNGWNLVS
jgi:hypothetical protein